MPNASDCALLPDLIFSSLFPAPSFLTSRLFQYWPNSLAGSHSVHGTRIFVVFVTFLRLTFLPRLTFFLVTKAPLCGRTSTSLWDRIPRLYHFHESPSMRYTFAPTSTLCPTDCARTAGAETGWCFAGSRKSGFSVSCFFFSTGGNVTQV